MSQQCHTLRRLLHALQLHINHKEQLNGLARLSTLWTAVNLEQQGLSRQLVFKSNTGSEAQRLAAVSYSQHTVNHVWQNAPACSASACEQPEQQQLQQQHGQQHASVHSYSCWKPQHQHHQCQQQQYPEGFITPWQQQQSWQQCHQFSNHCSQAPTSCSLGSSSQHHRQLTWLPTIDASSAFLHHQRAPWACLAGTGRQAATCSLAGLATLSRALSSNTGGDSTADTATTSSSGSGSSSGSWVDRYLPASAVPYAQLMRLDKPIGSWLLAWPGLWSIGLAAAPGHLPDPWLTFLFGTGAVLMRGAGCTINDLWDRDIDKQVERTRSRPLAAGTVTPFAALVFLGAQLSLGLAILLQLNMYTQVLGVASLSLVATYPLMKRITWWPQAFLGLAMNYGALMGYSAAAGACDWAVVAPLYLAGVNWTLIYDTIYAHQDKRDDAIVGVKSTALLFGEKTKTWATGFAVLQTLGMILAGQAAGCGLPFFAGVAAGSAHIAWQIRCVDLHNGPDCMAKFVSNKWYGAILYSSIVLDRLLVVS